MRGIARHIAGVISFLVSVCLGIVKLWVYIRWIVWFGVAKDTYLSCCFLEWSDPNTRMPKVYHHSLHQGKVFERASPGMGAHFSFPLLLGLLSVKGFFTSSHPPTALW